MKKWMRCREKLWRKYSSDDLWTAFKVVRWQYKTSIRKAKHEIISDKIQDCKGDTEKLYAHVQLNRKNPENPLPESENIGKLTNEFADFFLEKIQIIRLEIDQHPKYQPVRHDVPKLAEFCPMSDKEILKIMNGMQTKHCKLNAIPTVILKKLAPYIREIITRIVNVSLSQGKFPSQWKIASIRPLLKKLGLKLLSKNYRQVSNLSFLSKLVGKYMLSQFNNHCNLNGLIPTYQLAYRAFHCCETSLHNICNEALWSMENKKVMTLVVMDLCAAFDMEDHEIYLDILNRRFGIEGTALSWFSSYVEKYQCQFPYRTIIQV